MPAPRGAVKVAERQVAHLYASAPFRIAPGAPVDRWAPPRTLARTPEFGSKNVSRCPAWTSLFGTGLAMWTVILKLESGP